MSLFVETDSAQIEHKIFWKLTEMGIMWAFGFSQQLIAHMCATECMALIPLRAPCLLTKLHNICALLSEWMKGTQWNRKGLLNFHALWRCPQRYYHMWGPTLKNTCGKTFTKQATHFLAALFSSSVSFATRKSWRGSSHCENLVGAQLEHKTTVTLFCWTPEPECPGLLHKIHDSAVEICCKTGGPLEDNSQVL